MENKVQLRSPVVMVRVWFHFVLVNYCYEYEMMSMVKRYLVSWIIASFGWTNMCWKAGVTVLWRTKCNSMLPYILFWESVEDAVTTHHPPILCKGNCDSVICERDSCFQVPLNLRVWFQLSVAYQFQTNRILESRKNSGYSPKQRHWRNYSRLHKRIALNF